MRLRTVSGCNSLGVLQCSLLAQRPQDKFPFEHELVWDLQALVVDGLAIIQEDVKIDVSRTLVNRLLSSQTLFDRLQPI